MRSYCASRRDGPGCHDRVCGRSSGWLPGSQHPRGDIAMVGTYGSLADCVSSGQSADVITGSLAPARVYVEHALVLRDVRG